MSACNGKAGLRRAIDGCRDLACPVRNLDLGLNSIKTWYSSTTEEEVPLRGAAIHNVPGSSDPLLRAIAELRDQIDRLIDEQQVALEGFASGLDGDRSAVNRPALAVEASSQALPPTLQILAPGDFEDNRVPALRVSEPAPRQRRQADLEISNTVDDRSAVPPGSTAEVPREPGAGIRSDDPRERLDALVKHFDRRLRRSGSPPAGPPS